VGRPAAGPLEQEAICYLLLEKAREGKTVARLKWGDSCNFDRGASEALFLHEQGVPFEVVPGVPLEFGAASYAGVPLTYGAGPESVTFVRGRGHSGDGDTEVDVNWSDLARLDGSIVCYGGPDEILRMAGALLAGGRPPTDPAALIYDGTLPGQRTITGSLAEIAGLAHHSNERRAAVLVVGRVAGLRDHLRWFDRRPLFGKRILVTRPRDQAAQLVDLLESRGAEAIEAPMIRIAPPEDYSPLDQACLDVGRFDWIVFSSANAVDAFVGRLFASPLDLRALNGVKLCAVGPATAERLARHGLKVDLLPAEYRAEAMLQALSPGGHARGLKVFLPRGDIGRDVVAEELRKQGAEVSEAVAYRTLAVEPEREGGPDVYKMLLERRIDVVTFTSASAVRNFVRVLGAEPVADLLRPTLVASIGPVTAETAAQFGIETAIMPADYTIPALVNAIVQFFQVRADRTVPV
jgi:uroporphyrinogen III methyltransferase/synthase